MPIYAYKCSECGHELEAIQKMSDKLMTDCPHCGKAALVKQVTAAGFQLKGSGWYVTDFRDSGSGKKKDAAKADEKTKTEQASDASADAKADTKADSKADSKTPAPAESQASKAETKTDSKSESKSESGSKPAAAPVTPAPAAGSTSGKSGDTSKGTG